MRQRVVLVSCVKLKSATPAPARHLYTSALFRAFRRYAEQNADTWYVLSAEHGVLRPDQVVAPYDRTLNAMKKRERMVWAGRVTEQLLQLLPSGAEVTLLAGLRYREFVEPFLSEHGFSVQVPLRGMGLGEQLHHLKPAADEQHSL